MDSSSTGQSKRDTVDLNSLVLYIKLNTAMSSRIIIWVDIPYATSSLHIGVLYNFFVILQSYPFLYVESLYIY